MGRGGPVKSRDYGKGFKEKRSRIRTARVSRRPGVYGDGYPRVYNVCYTLVSLFLTEDIFLRLCSWGEDGGRGEDDYLRRNGSKDLFKVYSILFSFFFFFREVQ